MGEWDDSADNKKNLILPLSQSLIVPPSQSLLIPSPIFLSSQNQPTREDTLSSHLLIVSESSFIRHHLILINLSGIKNDRRVPVIIVYILARCLVEGICCYEAVGSAKLLLVCFEVANRNVAYDVVILL